MNTVVEKARVKADIGRRNMLLFAAGKLVSLFGTQIYSFALGLYVLKVTGSGASYATTLFVGLLPRVVFGPVSGIIADRFDRKKIVIFTDLLCGISILAFYGLSNYYGIRISFIYLFSFLLTTLNTFFDVALDASKPNLVDSDKLVKINSLGHGIMSMAAICGPFLGGIIYGVVDIRFFLLLNGISFILSAFSELFIDFDYNKQLEATPKETDRKGMVEEFSVGFNYIKKSKFLISVFTFSLMINFLIQFSITVPVPYLLNQVIGVTSRQYGLVQGFWPVGMLLGSLLLSILPAKEKLFKRLMFFMVLFIGGVYLLGMPMLPNLNHFSNIQVSFYYMIIMGLMGFAVAWIDIPLISAIQKEIPDDIRGRVFGLLGTISVSITPLGILLAGVLADFVPLYYLPIVSGIILTLLLFNFAKKPEIRKM